MVATVFVFHSSDHCASVFTVPCLCAKYYVTVTVLFVFFLYAGPLSDEGQPLATKVLMVIDVGITGHWRIPLAYCLTDGTNAELETKASSHQGQCIPAGSNVSPPRRMLITVSIIIMRYYAVVSRKLCARLFTLCKISTANLRVLWRHLATKIT